jgi:hypothetical protein
VVSKPGNIQVNNYNNKQQISIFLIQTLHQPGLVPGIVLIGIGSVTSRPSLLSKHNSNQFSICQTVNNKIGEGTTQSLCHKENFSTVLFKHVQNEKPRNWLRKIQQYTLPYINLFGCHVLTT